MLDKKVLYSFKNEVFAKQLVSTVWALKIKAWPGHGPNQILALKMPLLSPGPGQAGPGPGPHGPNSSLA